MVPKETIRGHYELTFIFFFWKNPNSCTWSNTDRRAYRYSSGVFPSSVQSRSWMIPPRGCPNSFVVALVFIWFFFEFENGIPEVGCPAKNRKWFFLLKLRLWRKSIPNIRKVFELSFWTMTVSWLLRLENVALNPPDTLIWRLHSRLFHQGTCMAIFLHVHFPATIDLRLGNSKIQVIR